MAIHALVPVVLFCTTLNPAADKVAGTFPKFLPLAIAVTITDLACAIVKPTVFGIVSVIADLATVHQDIHTYKHRK